MLHIVCYIYPLCMLTYHKLIYVYICLYMYIHTHKNDMKLGEQPFCLNLVKVLSYPVLFRDPHVSNMFLTFLCEI